jgi:hypothetical protein
MRRSTLPRRKCVTAPDRRLVRAGGDRDLRRDAEEGQQRREQKAATNAEHAGEKAHGRARAREHQHVRGNAGDGKIEREVHGPG